MNSQSPIQLSVVICTYNRSSLLAQALDTLCRQSAELSSYEIIVVDNNSKDNTKDVTEAFITKQANIRYCFEQQQGLSHARNRGWKSAQADYVAYIDDDCLIPAHWVKLALDVIREVKPGVFGGPYYPFYITEKPKWFKDDYGTHTQGAHPRILENNEYLDGMNIIFKKSILQSLGGFNPNLGMCGDKIAYGEETDIVRLARKSMPNELIYYHPQLDVQHAVRPEKMDMRWIVRQKFNDGCYAYQVFKQQTTSRKASPLLLRLAYRMILLLWHLTVGAAVRNRQQYPLIQNYFYEQAAPHLSQLGVAFEQTKEFFQTFKGKI
jgi:glycosyltransferase involved in cell wall biosynthesis